MILRKVTLENWRVHDHLELDFCPGLNVIQGRNEAGKSSLVEALDWALYRDITGARLKTDDLRAIVPATDPNARPRVEVELEFSNCRAVIAKTLAEDSGKRECHLIVRRDDMADEHFDRTDAQNKLKALFAADGLGEDKGALAEGTLLVAHQGEGIGFLTDGSTAIRSTLGVSNEGELALTRRLEKVRGAIEKLRRRELMNDLEMRAIDGARAGTEAATARVELVKLRDEKAHMEALSGEIESLRDDIEALETQLRELQTREAAAKKRIDDLGELSTKQVAADAVLKAAEVAARDATQTREALRRRVDEIARLQQQQQNSLQELEQLREKLQELEAELGQCREAQDKAQEERENTEHESSNARECMEAWRAVLDVYEARNRLQDEQRGLEELEALNGAVQTAQKTLDDTPKAPNPDELRGWREAWTNWQSLEAEAKRGLEIEITPNLEAKATWKADETEATEKLLLEANQATTRSAIANGALHIQGFGRIKIKTGARGVEELKNEVTGARAALQSLLSDWKVEVVALPQAIDVWETRRRTYEAALRARDEAAQTLNRAQERLGWLHDAQKRIDEAQTEFQNMKAAALESEKLIEFKGLKRPEVRQRLEAAQKVERELASRATRARNAANAAAQAWRSAEETLIQARNRPEAIKAVMEQRAEQLNGLCADNLNDDERREQLDALNQAAIRAQIAHETATSARRELGDGVSQWKVEDARREHLQLAGQRSDVEKKLVEGRTNLRHACDQDPNSRLQELEARLSELEPQVAAHEARLRGLALLDAAIQAERAKLSRDLAGPLNQKLGPWLSQLRGKETQLIFDENGTRIEKVRTREGEATIELPFSEHSEGMKEQVAFALRLILAGRVAKNLPSGKLPVILDDPFTQSDSQRREGLSQVLSDALSDLQILFVTCHAAPQAKGFATERLVLGEWDESLEGGPGKGAKPRPKRIKPVAVVEADTAQAEAEVAFETTEPAATLSLF